MDNIKVFLLLVALSSMSCDDDGETIDDKFQSGSEAEICDLTPIDEFELSAFDIEGDQLKLSTSYAGGCKVHDFYLCWDGTFFESNPVQALLALIHDGHGDTCKAILHTDLLFDLNPLKAAWQELHQQSSGVIQINLGEKRLEYAFF